ncbi:hypothetical protein [Micromonospora luteifusca]|uniref:hypothetical protein n=1 Tax=Micromonospora luteifusca TaxID=709860 RepID=UPI0033A5860A
MSDLPAKLTRDEATVIVERIMSLDYMDDAELNSLLDRPDERIQRARLLPGFREEPDCFMVNHYQLDKDYWTDGFVSIPHDED